MRILGRYVLREFATPLFYTLAGFFSIYILFELFASFGRLASAKPPALDIANYFLAYFAPQFKWFAPACLMLATLYTMWNFCRHSELIAMRASGIGFFAIVKPLLLVAALMAAFTWYVDEYYVPERSQWAKSFRSAKFKEEEMVASGKTLFRNQSESRTWSIARFVSADATTLADVTITDDSPSGVRECTISSPLAQYLDGAWWLVDPQIVRYDSAGEEIPQSATPSPADALTFRMFPFSETPRDFLLQNRNAIFYSVADRERYLELNPAIEPSVRREFEYNIWADRLAPLACIVITLFAIPAGVATGRQSVFKGVVGALAMFFAFYALTLACMAGAKLGYVPPVPAAVLPHAVFFLVGCMLFHRQR
ncbi:MAG: LptF/LptG family permease [Kiritimatiellae bacterium]|nr:LptF/LptG family permease [Kiritimatiellia bacterium]